MALLPLKIKVVIAGRNCGLDGSSTTRLPSRSDKVNVGGPLTGATLFWPVFLNFVKIQDYSATISVSVNTARFRGLSNFDFSFRIGTLLGKSTLAHSSPAKDNLDH